MGGILDTLKVLVIVSLALGLAMWMAQLFLFP